MLGLAMRMKHVKMEMLVCMLFACMLTSLMATPTLSADETALTNIGKFCNISGSVFIPSIPPCNISGRVYDIQCDHARRITELTLYSGALQFASSSVPLGCLTPVLLKLSKMRKLYLEGTGLEGTVPSEWGQLIGLRELRIYDHKLSGRLPSSFARLGNLRLLEISGRDCCLSQMEGPLPAQWRHLKKLQTLNLAFNQIHSKIPWQWGYMAAMQDLRLHFNRLMGTIPAQLERMTKLEKLWLSNNVDICGPLAGNLAKMLFPPGLVSVPLPKCPAMG